MSTQILAVIVMILAAILPYIGVQLPTDQLTEAIQTIVTIAAGAWIWYQRTRLQKAPFGTGDVKLSGIRKKGF